MPEHCSNFIRCEISDFSPVGFKRFLRFSQSTSSLESNLEGLASVLEADLTNYKTKIIRILCDW